MEGLDGDMWRYFEITGIIESNLNVKKPYRLWWMLDEEVNFRVIKVNVNAAEIKDYASKKTILLIFLLSMMLMK